MLLEFFVGDSGEFLRAVEGVFGLDGGFDGVLLGDGGGYVVVLGKRDGFGGGYSGEGLVLLR